jgi:hypothetical protein
VALNSTHFGEAMQPPCAGGEDGLAADQVVGAGFAVAIDEGGSGYGLAQVPPLPVQALWSADAVSGPPL